MKRDSYIVLILLLLFAGVTSGQQKKERLQWPSTPQQARITHVQTISSLGDVGAEQSWFGKILGFIFGDEESSHWLVQPVGIALTESGRIYVADPGSQGVHMIDREDKRYEFIDGVGNLRFISPVGIAIDSDGRVYVSDSQRGEILVLDDDHSALFVIKERLVRPTGVAISGNQLYVTDTGQHKVLVFDRKGKFLREFGVRGSGSGELNFPVHIAARDTLYIVDAMNHRVQMFDLQGKAISSFGGIGNAAGSFANPKSLAVDSDRNLYVTDALLDCFQIFDRSGQLLLVVGSNGTADGEFMSPSGIAVDVNDNIYVADALNRRIQVFRYLKEKE